MRIPQLNINNVIGGAISTCSDGHQGCDKVRKNGTVVTNIHAGYPFNNYKIKF